MLIAKTINAACATIATGLVTSYKAGIFPVSGINAKHRNLLTIDPRSVSKLKTTDRLTTSIVSHAFADGEEVGLHTK